MNSILRAACVFTLGVIIGLLLAVRFVTYMCTEQPTHNAAGGYIEACGDEPGMLGDDC
jgi:hypothetical protein